MTALKAFPTSVDVAIVGGGIIGIATAYSLARHGVSVAVFEKGTLGCEQSSRNWGWVRTLMRDQAEVPLALQAQGLWAEIQRKTDVGFKQTGIMYLAGTAKELQEYESWLKKASPLGVNAVLLDSQDVLDHIPHTTHSWAGGLYSPTDGVAEPALATLGIAKLARDLGVQIFERCAARGISTNANSVSALHTEHGVVGAKTVLVAGGAWSRLFCGNMGVSVPQLKVRASVLRTSPISSPVSVAINGRTFTCRSRLDGGYTISQFNASYADIVPDSFRLLKHFLPAWIKNKGLVKLRFGKQFFRELKIKRSFSLQEISPFEQHRVLAPLPAEAAVASSLTKMQRAFPAFKQARIEEMWGGYIDVTPDALPIMSRISSSHGVFLATGFSGHGFGIGPAVGEAMADLMLGRKPSLDLSPFDIDRFVG